MRLLSLFLLYSGIFSRYSPLPIHRAPGVDDVGQHEGNDERHPAHGGEGEVGRRTVVDGQ